MTTGRSLFSPLPPAFAAVPRYLVHITVDLLPLTEPDKRLSHTSGSSANHSDSLPATKWISGSLRALSAIRVRSVLMGSHSLHSANVSPFTGD